MLSMLPRLVIAGLSGDTGKTVLSLGLIRALTRRGYRIQTFKKGPDYIDALWLGLASGLKPRNIDPYMLEPSRWPALFEKEWAALEPRPDMVIIEGNRGIFDGLDLAGSCSTAELARQLNAPVILAVNCTKMTRTAAALVHGCKTFEPGLNLAGVILNRVNRSRHREIVKSAVEELAGVPVLGAMPVLPEAPLNENRRGLLAGEAVMREDSALRRLTMLADLVEEHIDIDAVAAVAKAAPLPITPAADSARPAKVDSVAAVQLLKRPEPRIAYVRDAAFWAYYSENLEALEHAGAKLLEVSLLSDVSWPEFDGLYIGGGCPEDFAERLSGNRCHMRELAHMIEAGLPVYAEGNALYYLGKELRLNGVTYPMCGIFDLSCEIGSAPQGLGYVQAMVEKDNPYFPRESIIKAHEFHYSTQTSTAETIAGCVLRLDKGVGLFKTKTRQRYDGLLSKNCFAGRMQVFAPGTPCWAANFVAAAEKYSGNADK